MKTILIPTDYSSNAQHAIEYAVTLAKCFDAKLIMLHTFHLPCVKTGPDGYVLLANTTGWQNVDQQQTGHIKQSACQIASTFKISVEGIAVEGFLVDVLPDIVEEYEVDLVVMGMRGMGTTERLMVGSVTTSVLNLATFPLLIIPTDARLQVPKKLLFACAYPTPTGYSLRLLQDMLRDFEAEITIFHVEEREEALEKGEYPRQSELHLERAFRDRPHQYSSLADQDVVAGIERALEEQQPDWLVMIPQVHRFLKEVTPGGHTYQMAFRSTIPLLALPDDHPYTEPYE